MDTIVPPESLKRWSKLLSRRCVAVPTTSSTRSSTSQPPAHGAAAAAGDAPPDPFDCTDIAVPPTHVLVEQELERAAGLWRNLDKRRVLPERREGDPEYRRAGRKKKKKRRLLTEEEIGPRKGEDQSVANGKAAADDDNDDDGGGDDDGAPDRLGGDYGGLDWGWHANRVRLPEGFDVTCRRGPPSPPAEQAPTAAAGDGGDGDGEATAACSSGAVPSDNRRRSTIVSLLDPTDRLDYETELWKVFHSVPTEEEIEREATVGALCTELLEVRREIESGLKDYPRLDGHGLGRMRLRDRHGLPSRIWAPGKQPTPAGGGAAADTSTAAAPSTAAIECDGVTIRVECWRRMMKRGSSPDCHRLEIELRGGRTLDDLHRIILELGRGGAGVVAAPSDGGGSFDGRTKVFSDSGMFFIEGTFYTRGEVDYASPVIEWLDGRGQGTSHAGEGSGDSGALAARTNPERKQGQDGGAKNPSPNPPPPPPPAEAVLNDPIHPLRRNYLGIPPRSNGRRPVGPVPMSTVRLDSIPFKLGTRYLHVCDGDREVALFFTDVRTVLKGEDVSRYPLLHDVWTTSTPRPDCSGCGQSPPVVMTYRDMLTNGDPTPLCEGCYRALHYAADGTLHRGGGDDMRVFPLNLVLGWADSTVGSEPVDVLF